ncbi:MAG: hypothetical protein ABSD57_08445 [Verrucomicrobiota bacterium]|jgi:hypothetical protein
MNHLRLTLVLLALTISVRCAFSGEYPESQRGILSGDLVARALSDPSYSIALCEFRASPKVEDYRLKSGLNLMASTFPELLNENKVKCLFVTVAIKGEFDNVVVYEEKLALSKQTVFVPPLGTKWIVIFQKESSDKLKVEWKTTNPPTEMPVLQLASRKVGVELYEEDDQARDLLSDLRLLTVAFERRDKAYLQGESSKLKTECAKQAAAKLLAEGFPQVNVK